MDKNALLWVLIPVVTFFWVASTIVTVCILNDIRYELVHFNNSIGSHGVSGTRELMGR